MAEKMDMIINLVLILVLSILIFNCFFSEKTIPPPALELFRNRNRAGNMAAYAVPTLKPTSL